ncbi:low molecular weight protein-tyrosine-phosphatase [Hahella sp. NBU794]|uniref:low molecular weight protein-tyrosine-phosphatase n=1 Tax=Hahella sp. NBU794 TaxID=3422590 RepID=UPI003D6F7B44
MINILFVCMGNICRSPTAHGVFEAFLQRAGLTDCVEVDSAGTGGWHAGELPDRRAREFAGKRGYSLEHIRARQVTPDDFEQFDLVLAMDRDNLANLQHICPQKHQSKVKLFLDFASSSDEREVPDPYYGGPQGFEHVLDLVEDACQGLVEHVQGQLKHRG